MPGSCRAWRIRQGVSTDIERVRECQARDNIEGLAAQTHALSYRTERQRTIVRVFVAYVV
jgi:hypothetical protein